MDQQSIREIFKANALADPQSFRKINVGFTNQVYAVDERYILKVCSDCANEKPFSIEAKLYERFKAELPVPKLIAFDTSKTLLPKLYMLISKIDGENLYNVWHMYSNQTRRDIIQQLCGMLRRISNTDYSGFISLLDPVSCWKDVILARIEKYKLVCTDAGTLSLAQAQKIDQFCANFANCLDEQRIALVYWDAHFDNVLVKNHRIVGILDFERTELASIDFMLDIVKRMMEFPTKYMSKYAQQFANAEDYLNLMKWYKEFYPELFAFKQLERRLDFYSLAHNLEDLENWPHVRSLKDTVEKIIA